MVSGDELIARAKAQRVREFKVGEDVFYVRKLSGTERRLFAERARSGNPMLAAELAYIGICNPDGSAALTSEQATALDEEDPELIERFAEEVLRSAGWFDKIVEASRKN